MVGFQVPAMHLTTPQNPFVCAILSKFQRFYTVRYSWDVQPAKLQLFIECLKKENFTYVPFELFAEPSTYRWEYDWRLAAQELGISLHHTSSTIRKFMTAYLATPVEDK